MTGISAIPVRSGLSYFGSPYVVFRFLSLPTPKISADAGTQITFAIIGGCGWLSSLIDFDVSVTKQEDDTSSRSTRVTRWVRIRSRIR